MIKIDSLSTHSIDSIDLKNYCKAIDKLIVYITAIKFLKLIFKKLRPVKQNIKLDWPIYLCFSQKTPKDLRSKKKEKSAP